MSELTPRVDEDGCEDTEDALAIILTGRHVDSQNIGDLNLNALHRIRNLQDTLAAQRTTLLSLSTRIRREGMQGVANEIEEIVS